VRKPTKIDTGKCEVIYASSNPISAEYINCKALLSVSSGRRCGKLCSLYRYCGTHMRIQDSDNIIRSFYPELVNLCYEYRSDNTTTVYTEVVFTRGEALMTYAVLDSQIATISSNNSISQQKN
jgi:hypothetical protein